MPTSHCLPNGQLGTNELPVPNISGATVTVFNPPGGVGARRGVVVFKHGLLSPQQIPVPPQGGPTGPGGSPLGDSYSALGAGMPWSYCQNLAQLGWVVLAVPSQEDFYPGSPGSGIGLDCQTIQSGTQSSTANGARYLASTLHTWDHIYTYIQQTYGYGTGTATAWQTSGTVPVVLTGFSIGAWKTLSILANRTSQISGAISIGPPTYFENVSSLYVVNPTYNSMSWQGSDLQNNSLNSIGSVPTIIGYGTNDAATFYAGQQTLTSYTGGTATLSASATGFTVPSFGGLGYATITGSGGGLPVTFSFTGISGAQLTGCTTLSTNTTLPTGTLTCTQSVLTPMINNAISAGRSVTGNTTGQIHTLSVGDSGYYNAGSAVTLSTSASTSVTITAVQGSYPQGSANNNAIGATGTSAYVWNGTSFVAVTGSPSVSGTTMTFPAQSSAITIPANGPIVNGATVSSGYYTNISYPYWVATVLNPSFPATG